MTRIRYPALIFHLSPVILLFLCSCTHEPLKGEQYTQAQRAVKEPGLELNISPSPPRQLAPSTFIVSARSPIPAAGVVKVTLTMPSMSMPPTVITTTRKLDGTYQGSGAFTMDGNWQAEILLTSPGKRLVKQVSVQVR